jgi:hypothetical protein
MLGVQVDDDCSADIAAIVERAANNLQKCRYSERCFLRFDDIVDFGRKYAERLGVPFEPPERPVSKEGAVIEQDLLHLRGLLQSAVNNRSVKDARRLVNLIISGEKRLHREYLDSGLYLRREGVAELSKSMAEKIIAKHRHEPNWNERVDALLAEHDHSSTGERPQN